MSLGEVNKGVVALLLVLVLGAAGFLWWSRMYTPAVEAKVAAAAAEATAQGGLSAAKAELAAAQERIEQARTDAGKLDDSVGKVAIARKAVPSEQQFGDAAIVLMDLAERSGVSTGFVTPDPGNGAGAAEGGGASGAVPIDLEFEAAGTYSEMMLFMSLVEDTVVEKDGKLYTRDRLFNVVSLKIGSKDENEEPAGTESDNGPIVQRGDMLFTVTIRMYTSSPANSAEVGANTPDAAAAPTEGTGTGTGATADAGATGTDAGAAGGSTPGGTTSDATGAGATGTGTGAPSGSTGAPTTNDGAAPAASGGF